jgi:hypothetical protein
MKNIVIILSVFLGLFVSSLEAEEPATKKMMYTTYFYTAGEAVLHGYENNTKVRIASLDGKKGTIWEGTIDLGKTKLIPTGRGVFAFFSDKKASILVGTPSRCAVVGYWVRDRNGSYRSDYFFSQLPSATNFTNDKVIVWAWDDAKVQITNMSSDKVIHQGKLKANSFYEIGRNLLQGMPNHVLQIKADKKNISVQVYYDEGFFVPAENGRAAGKKFYTYLGDTTNQNNDLQIYSYATAAKVVIEDIKTKKIIHQGTIEAGQVLTKTLSNVYLKITSDKEVNVAVSPYLHYRGAYNEHHFGVGQEGGGIENNFLLTTPEELWVFSYYSQNQVTVSDPQTKKVVWSGTLQAGQVAEVRPGWGYYQVKSTKGVSVMGGHGACGAEFSPAGGMFEVDEQLFAIIQQVKEERIRRAAAQGKKLSAAELNAPLSNDEAAKVQSKMSRSKSAPKKMSVDEIQERAAQIQSNSN